MNFGSYLLAALNPGGTAANKAVQKVSQPAPRQQAPQPTPYAAPAPYSSSAFKGLNVLSTGSNPNAAAQFISPPKPSVLGASTTTPYSGAAPATSGQPAAPSGGNPSQDNGGDNYLNILRGNYDNARSGIEAQGSALDQTYDTSKNDIQSSIDQAVQAGDTQKQAVTKQFGDILRNQLQTYQDLNRQRQGTFSSLGTLDSSAFGEQQFRGDQDFAQGKLGTETNQANTLNAVDTQVGAYRKQAESDLAKLTTQYQAGKQGIAQALAQGNLNEASAIQSAIDQIQARAQQVQDNYLSLAQQAAVLKKQGVDVIGTLGGITGDGYAQQVADQLAKARQFGASLIPQLLSQPTGAGYIGAGTKRDPITGLPIA